MILNHLRLKGVTLVRCFWFSDFGGIFTLWHAPNYLSALLCVSQFSSSELINVSYCVSLRLMRQFDPPLRVWLMNWTSHRPQTQSRSAISPLRSTDSQSWVSPLFTSKSNHTSKQILRYTTAGGVTRSSPTFLSFYILISSQKPKTCILISTFLEM